jgi:hypothetical protein
LADERQTALHPFEQRVAAPEIEDHSQGKPAHKDGDGNNNNSL